MYTIQTNKVNKMNFKCDGVWKYVGSHTNVAGSHSQAGSTCGVSSKLPVESGAPQTL